MAEPSIQTLSKALHASWPVDSPSYVWQDWTPDNPSRGQCVPTALIVQDYYGGDITRVRIKGEGLNETHYFNVLDDGTVIDMTFSQYHTPVTIEPAPIDLKKKGYASVREKCLSDEETNDRYKILKGRVKGIISLHF